MCAEVHYGSRARLPLCTVTYVASDLRCLMRARRRMVNAAYIRYLQPLSCYGRGTRPAVVYGHCTSCDLRHPTRVGGKGGRCCVRTVPAAALVLTDVPFSRPPLLWTAGAVPFLMHRGCVLRVLSVALVPLSCSRRKYLLGKVYSRLVSRLLRTITLK